MKNSMSKVIAALLVITMCLGLTCFASADDLAGKIVVVTSWNETETQGDVFIQVAKDFEALHPNVKVELQFMGRELRDIIKPMLESGQQVDIFTVGYIGNKSPVESYLLNLDHMLSNWCCGHRIRIHSQKKRFLNKSVFINSNNNVLQNSIKDLQGIF